MIRIAPASTRRKRPPGLIRRSSNATSPNARPICTHSSRPARPTASTRIAISPGCSNASRWRPPSTTTTRCCPGKCRPTCADPLPYRTSSAPPIYSEGRRSWIAVWIATCNSHRTSHSRNLRAAIPRALGRSTTHRRLRPLRSCGGSRRPLSRATAGVCGNTPPGCFWCVLCGVLVIAEWRVILFLNLYLFRVIECN